jgi:hypothetical protein
MSDRLSGVEERLRQLDEAVTCLSRRLERLEHGDHFASDLAAPARTAAGGSVQIPRAPRSDAIVLVSLAGRTCLVFGGAYLLRALTESGNIPAMAGVLLGLAYAVAWLGAAERAKPPSALFHGIATVFIGLPIVWEAAGRFGFLTPTQGAMALAVVVGLALIVAWHRRLPLLASTIVLGALATSVALAATLARVVPFAALLLGCAGAGLWIAYHRGWTWLAVLTGLAADLAVLAVLWRAVAIPPRDPGGFALALQIVLLAIYLGSFIVRALMRSPLGIFEYVQGSLVLAIGLGGTIALSRGDAAIASVGTVTAACAGAAYWIGFGPLRRRRASGATLHFFTSLALVLTLVAGRLLLADASYALALSGAAIAATGIGRLLPSSALRLHAAIALAVAAIPSGVLTLIGRVWLLPVAEWPAVTPAAWGVIAATLVLFTFWWSRADEVTAAVVVGARTAIGALMVAGLGTFVVVSIGRILEEALPAAGTSTIVKSVVLAGSTVFLAWTRNVPEVADLSRLTYPLLVAAGLKILLQDLPSARPAVLFVVLGLYGASLIMTPTVLRGQRRDAPQSSSP